MVDIAESSVEFNRISESDVSLPRCIKLNDRTVYNFERSNESEKNPNSCIDVVHEYVHESDRDKIAVAELLAALLSDPAFTQLRTQEQLGYIVFAS